MHQQSSLTALPSTGVAGGHDKRSFGYPKYRSKEGLRALFEPDRHPVPCTDIMQHDQISCA